MWYTPWAFQRYERREDESEDKETRSKLRKRLIDDTRFQRELMAYRRLLEYASITKAEEMEMARQRRSIGQLCLINSNQ